MKLEQIIQSRADDKEIKRQKQIAEEILCKLSEAGHPEAIVAGGAPRNWKLNKPANDLDIYVSAPFESHELSSVVDLGCVLNLGSKHYDYGKIANIKQVQETCIDSMKVQFITFNSKSKKLNPRCDCLLCRPNYKEFAHEIFRTFDFGICKIAWNKSEFIISDQFAYDFFSKKLTVNMKEIIEFNDPSSLPRRVKKMKKYFPDYELDIV